MPEPYSDYTPNEAIRKALGVKKLLTFVGPTGVGKSTILDAVTKLDGTFGRTGSLTTRSPEPRDMPGLMEYLSREEFERRIHAREVVNVSQFSATGHLYGTDVAMYRHDFNMLEALPGSISYFDKLPFKLFKTMSLVTDADAWQTWLLERYPEESPERSKRAKEAILNLEWSLKHAVNWIHNQPNQAEKTARRIIAVARHQGTGDNGRHLAEAMLERAKNIAVLS